MLGISIFIFQDKAIKVYKNLLNDEQKRLNAAFVLANYVSVNSKSNFMLINNLNKNFFLFILTIFINQYQNKAT